MNAVKRDLEIEIRVHWRMYRANLVNQKRFTQYSDGAVIEGWLAYAHKSALESLFNVRRTLKWEMNH